MNRDYLLFNLREAQSELERTIREIETSDDYGDAELAVAMSHVYHHVNTAWNARDATEQAARQCSEQDFDRWRRFPRADELFLE